MNNKKLVLESGDIFYGKGFGANENFEGEIIFHTGMTGYQEIISDPAYFGQIICMTYPLIGNYGINRDDYEGIKPSVKGLIVKELCDFPSNFRSQIPLNDFFKKKNISGIEDIDTRRLTRILREKGKQKGKIVDIDANEEDIINELRNSINSLQQVTKVSTETPYASPGRGTKIVILDFGTKLGILRELSLRNCDITVMPHNTSAEEILLMNPDGLLLSGGPGNPQELPFAQETVRQLIGKIPILGINLGHLILGMACGAKIKSLKTGIHGGTPVLNLTNQKVILTSQNQNFSLEQESLKNTDLEETYITLNNKLNQGIRHKKHTCLSVQFNPEANPGPEDSRYIFDEFINMIEKFKK